MSKKISRGLGRGLDALIPETPSPQEWKPRTPVVLPPMEGTALIELRFIEVNPNQPRTDFNEEALAELAESIKQLGVIQPITIRRMGPDSYQLISGERRLRASHLAGLTHIPAYVRQIEDSQLLALALVENIQRENLDAMEIAVGFQRLMDECALTQEEMAQRVGKKRATVANYLRLLQLPVTLQLMVRAGDLSMGHAKAILSLDGAKKQEALARRIVEKGLSVRQAEALVKESAPKPKAPQDIEVPESYYRVLEHLGGYFKDNISVKSSPQGGHILTIHCTDDAQMDAFLTMLDHHNS